MYMVYTLYIADYVTILTPFFHPLHAQIYWRCTVVQPVGMTDTYPRVSFRSYRRALMIHFVGGSADLLVRLDVRGVCLGSRSWTVNVHVTENARAIRLDGDLSAISIGNTDRQHDLIRLRLVVYSRATMRNDELLTRASEIVRYRSWLGELVWDRVRWIEKGLSKLEL